MGRTRSAVAELVGRQGVKYTQRGGSPTVREGVIERILSGEASTPLLTRGLSPRCSDVNRFLNPAGLDEACKRTTKHTKPKAN
jgi:hypothetical protein